MSYLTYHDKVVGDIRIAKESDCQVLGNNLCEQDAQELYNYDRSSPVDACLNSFKKSTVVMTVEHNAKIVAMFGIMDLSDGPTMWLLKTNGLKLIGRNFLRNTKDWIRKMLEIYPVLIAYVDLRNRESRKWLDFVGGRWDGKVNMGVDMMPFQRYKFSREIWI
jgi:hypothetical protein